MDKMSVDKNISLKNVNNVILVNFLNYVYDFLSSSREFIDLLTFHNFINYPFTISEKLFNSFTKINSKKLTQKVFSKKISTLYNGTIEKRIKLLFRFLDVDNDGKIHVEDVKFLFKYFHIMYDMKNKQEMKYIINTLFHKVDYITEFEFKIFLSKVSSDIYYLGYYFFLKNVPFQTEEIEYFAKINNMNILKDFSKKTTSSSETEDESLLPPSEHIIKYINQDLPEIDLSSEEDLDELKSFENELGQIRENFREKKEQSSDELINIKINSFINNKNEKNKEEDLCWENKKQNVTINILKVPNNSKEIKEINFEAPYTFLKPLKFQESDNNLPVCNTMIHMFNQKVEDLSKNIECFLIEKGKKGEIIPIKMSIQNHMIFIWKKKKFDSIFLLRKKAFIISNSQKVVIIQEQMYYSITFQFQFNATYKDVTILFKEEKSLKNFIFTVKNILAHKKPNDTYKVIKVLAETNKAVIRLCENKITNQMVSIKFCKKSNHSTYDTEIQLVQEIEISQYLSKLSKNNGKQLHNLITFVDYFESQNFCYIVSLFLSGQPLSVYLSQIDDINITKQNYNNNRYYLPLELTTKIINQVIPTVTFLHKKGIVHRNLSPENLMINLDKESKDIVTTIIGFNQGKVLLPFEKTKQKVMFNNYNSPEIARGLLHDKKSDTWTIGVLTYYLLYKEFIVSENDLKNPKINSITKVDNCSKEDYSQIHPHEIKIKNELIGVGLWKIIKAFVNFDEEKRPDLILYHL